MKIQPRPFRCQIWFTLLFLALPCGCQSQLESESEDQKKDETESHQTTKQETDSDSAWIEQSLFDGKSMSGWDISNFGGSDEAEIVEGEIILSEGYPLSGINRDPEEDLPRSNYVIELEAKRIEGIDFFCGLTFPVQDSYCSLIVAGWAGATVGLSCIDDKDASSNDSTCYHNFDNDRWYRIKVKVTDAAIVCWIDDEEVINQTTTGHKISLRGDVSISKPLGLSAFESKVAYRNINLKYQATATTSDETGK